MDQIPRVTFDDPKIARLYRDVPVEQVARLHRFRADYPPQRATIDGVEWEYLDTAQGDAPLLVLTGALGTAESSWQSIAHLAGAYRVIAPSYPPSITTAVSLVDGIAAILDQAGLDQVPVMGGSMGGYIAQVFVRRHQDRTAKLIVSHAGPPDPERGAKIEGALRWLRLLPMGLLRAIVSARLGGLLPEGHEQSAFLRAFLMETQQVHWTKEAVMNTYRRAVDFDLRYTFAPEDLVAWPGEILLIMADDDPSTPAPVREEMVALYPQAQVYMFHGTGHAAALVKQEEYFAVIEAFLASGRRAEG